MSLEGTATGSNALRGKIHSLVIDKSLSIPGACADAKATGDAIVEAIEKGFGSQVAALTDDEIKAICV